MHLVYMQLTAVVFFQICQYFPFASFICFPLWLNVSFPYSTVERHVYELNKLTKYLCYRRHLYGWCSGVMYMNTQ